MLNIRLAEDDWLALARWGHEVDSAVRSIEQAARLLLDLLRGLEGEPPSYTDCPKPRRYRPGGVTTFDGRVNISQTTDSASTRALWMWGYERGCLNVADSMRLLISKIKESYPKLDLLPEKPRIDCLTKLATLIEEKSHFVEHIGG